MSRAFAYPFLPHQALLSDECTKGLHFGHYAVGAKQKFRIIATLNGIVCSGLSVVNDEFTIAFLGVPFPTDKVALVADFYCCDIMPTVVVGQC